MILVLLIVVLSLGGCASLQDMFGIEDDELPLVNGTTTGNILNGGFAVKYGEDLLVYYTGGGSYDYGSIVMSNPDKEESSLVLDEGGLYLNIVGDSLYYCREDGVYCASLTTHEATQVLDRNVSLLQIDDGAMYFIEDGRIDSTTTGGQPRGFAPIDNAACLNVYGEALYYIDTDTGYICTACLDGSDADVFYQTKVNMCLFIDDAVYYIDGTDGNIKRMLLDKDGLETVVAYACSGFNVNRKGMYYTRNVDGQDMCCNAGADGFQENVITEFGESAWHRACMWGEAAIIVPQEAITE